MATAAQSPDVRYYPVNWSMGPKRILEPSKFKASRSTRPWEALNGEGGIRTRGRDKPYTAFPRLLDKPLRHLSGVSKIEFIPRSPWKSKAVHRIQDSEPRRKGVF
jgi:hypothetical protein